MARYQPPAMSCSPSLSRAFQRRLSMDSQTVGSPGGSPKLARRMSLTGESQDTVAAMQEAQEQALLPMKEDLADWLSNTLGVEIDLDNFFDSLDNGVFLCQLARIIQSRAHTEVPANSQRTIPHMKIKCKESARSGTWFARDNIANFLQWCRNCGVKEELMFETEELVCHRQRKNILLCVMDVARIASNFGIEPPGLISLEKEIEQEEAIVFNIDTDADNVFKTPLPMRTMSVPNGANGTNGASSRSSSRASSPNASPRPTRIPTPRSGTPSGRERSCSRTRRLSSSSSVADSMDGMSSYGDNDSTPVARGRTGSISKGPNSTPRKSRRPSAQEKPKDSGVLDKQVRSITGACQCPQCYQVERLAEGRYNVGGKIVFVRLLKGRHVMVRVGGGWDTLEHYIATHDPCKVIEVRRSQSTLGMSENFSTPTKTPSRNSEHRASVPDRYLHMQGRYRSDKKAVGKS